MVELTVRLPRTLILAIGILFLMAACPTGEAGQLPRFVDLDGDGFDDNAPDDDADGIPDEFESHSFFSAAVVSLGVGQMFGGTSSVSPTNKPTSAAEKFGRREFQVRFLCGPRTDFEADFASGLGLGGGLGGGGACAGGICF